MKQSLKRQYFDDLYAQNPDPWHFATKAYEHEKYAFTLEHLPCRKYEMVLELGCSIGVLTDLLAPRANHLVSLDAAQAALEQAKGRCAHHDNVEFKCATLPRDYPVGQFDLILMSEVGYYFDRADLRVLSQKMLKSLKPGGDLVMVHYLPVVMDYPLTGDDVHEFFEGLETLKKNESYRKERYRFDSFRRFQE